MPWRWPIWLGDFLQLPAGQLQGLKRAARTNNIHEMNIDDMDLNLLRTFQVVADERSVTKAAERLSLGQPAVSNGL